MHTPQEPTRVGDVFQQAQQVANAAANGSVRSCRAFTLSFRDIDIPCVVAGGEVYVQTTLPEFFDAVQATLVDVLRDLEIGISEARRTALASADLFPEIRFEGVVVEDVVRGRGEQ